MIGTHIKKEKTILLSLKKFYYLCYFQLPCQIFTGSTKGWKRPERDYTIEKETLDYVTENNIKFFIHSIYLINFGRPKEECEKSIECLTYDLNVGKELGSKGVVVHVGKALKMGKDIATENMYNNIINMLEYINPSCPLIIESPAGQGTELLTSYKEFSDFYNRFNKEQKEKIKICIDTCHIFSAQVEHTPTEYIIKWNEEHPGSLIIVHFNDSQGGAGCCKDRHRQPGLGLIGLEELDKVEKYCTDNNIPMVLEN
jgi:deoxyribonuclease-4